MMIKFFRKIRQKLLSEGKTGTYLKYAIGEIVLVVVGILIALQINNWNDKRKSIEHQFDQLVKLRSEIVSLKNFLEYQHKYVILAESNSKQILELMGPQASLKISPDSLKNLFNNSINTGLPSEERVSLRTDINLDKLPNKKYTKKLFQLLLEWRQSSGGIASDFQLIEDNREKELNDVLIKNGIPGIMYISFDWESSQTSSFNINYDALLQSHEIFAAFHHRYVRLSALNHDVKYRLGKLEQMIFEIDKLQQLKPF